MFTKLGIDRVFDNSYLTLTANQINRLINKELELSCAFTPYTIVGPKGKREIISKQDVASHNSESLSKCFESQFGKQGTVDLSKSLNRSAFETICLYLRNNDNYINLIDLSNVSEVVHFALQHDQKKLFHQCCCYCHEEMKKAVVGQSSVTKEELYLQIVKPIIESLNDKDVKCKLINLTPSDTVFQEYPLYEAEYLYKNLQKQEIDWNITKEHLILLNALDGLEFKLRYSLIERVINERIERSARINQSLGPIQFVEEIKEFLNEMTYISKGIRAKIAQLHYIFHGMDRKYSFPGITENGQPVFFINDLLIEKLDEEIKFIKSSKILFLLNWIYINDRNLSVVIKCLTENLTKEQIEKINIIFTSKNDHTMREKFLINKICSLKEEFPNSTLPYFRLYKNCDDFAHLISIEQLDNTPIVLADEKGKEKEAS